MAFAVKKKESVRKAVKRLGRRRMAKALGALEHCNRLDAVHNVRKDIKRVRALLRLVRGAMAKADYRRATDLLREAAGYLGAARDAHVKLNALADLASQFEHELPARPFGEIKGILAEDCRKQQTELARMQAPRKVGRLLKRLSEDSAAFGIKRSGWSALAPGIERSFHLLRSDGARRRSLRVLLAEEKTGRASTLLRECALSHSERAFATLVSRHVNLVLSVALRQVCGRHLAEDIAQSVFTILAREAQALGPETIHYLNSQVAPGPNKWPYSHS